MTAHRVLADGLIAEHEIPDPGASGTIQVDKSPAIVNVVTAAAETRVISAPQTSGLRLVINLKTDGDDATITQEGSGAFNASGHTTLTLDDVGDHANLISMDVNGTLLWRDAGNGGDYS